MVCHVVAPFLHPPPPSNLRLLIELNFFTWIHVAVRRWQVEGTVREKDTLGRRNIMEAHADHESVPLRPPPINPVADWH